MKFRSLRYCRGAFSSGSSHQSVHLVHCSRSSRAISPSPRKKKTRFDQMFGHCMTLFRFDNRRNFRLIGISDTKSNTALRMYVEPHSEEIPCASVHHTHKPGHVPGSYPTCGAPRDGSTVHSLLQQIRAFRRIGGHTGGESQIYQGHHSLASLLQDVYHPNRNGSVVVECNRQRRRRHRQRLAWHDPSAATSGSAVGTLWGVFYRLLEVRFRRLARSHGVRRGKRTEGLRHGIRPFWGVPKRRG